MSSFNNVLDGVAPSNARDDSIRKYKSMRKYNRMGR